MTQLLMPEGEVGSTTSQLTEAITAISTRIYFDTSILPTDVPNMCTIHIGELYETVWYTVKEPTYIDVSERGFDGTTAQAWGAGANVARYVCNYDFSAIHHNVADHETRIGTLESAPTGDFIPKVTTPTTGNFPQLDSTGALVNSTYDETSFAASSHTHDYTAVFAAIDHTHDFTDDFAAIDHTHAYSALTGKPGAFNLTWDGAFANMTAASNYGYAAMLNGRVEITLPAGATDGDVVGVSGYYNWKLVAPEGGTINGPRWATGQAFVDSESTSDVMVVMQVAPLTWQIISETRNVTAVERGGSLYEYNLLGGL